jgi:hypothetical protein
MEDASRSKLLRLQGLIAAGVGGTVFAVNNRRPAGMQHLDTNATVGKVRSDL